MFAQRGEFFKGPLGLLALLAALLAIGCGSDDGTAGEGATTGAVPEAAEPDVAGADEEDVEVIRGWAEALAGGEVDRAAAYFALPSIAENGPLRTPITDREDAVAFNDSLPCGAELLSAETSGELTTARFRLIERPGGDCGPGVGETASTAFLIEDGAIVEWRRVVDPSERGSSGERTT